MVFIQVTHATRINIELEHHAEKFQLPNLRLLNTRQKIVETLPASTMIKASAIVAVAVNLKKIVPSLTALLRIRLTIVKFSLWSNNTR